MIHYEHREMNRLVLFSAEVYVDRVPVEEIISYLLPDFIFCISHPEKYIIKEFIAHFIWRNFPLVHVF